MWPQTASGESGWSFCNLTNAVVSKCKTREDVINAVMAASYLGTMQSYYTDFSYLGAATEEIVRRDALMGVGLTGMGENPSLIFDANLQKEAALAVIKANEELAAILGINPAARTTVVKPDGNTSQMLGTSSTPGDFR